MPLRRLSLYNVVALTMFGLSVVALSLLFISARIYRDLSHEHRASAMRAFAHRQAHDRLRALAAAQRIRALDLARDPAFRTAWRRQNIERLTMLLRAALRGPGRGPARDSHRTLDLQRIRLLDRGLVPIAGVEAVPAGVTVGCPKRLGRPPAGASTGRGRGAPMSRICLHDGGVSVRVLVPLPGLRPPGYIELVGNGLAALRGISGQPGLALRIERPDGTVLFESPDWEERTSGVVLRTRSLMVTDHGEPLFTIRAASDLGGFSRRLGTTRDFVLIVAGVIIAATLLAALVGLRHWLRPLRALQHAAEQLSHDVDAPGIAASSDPVPERGPAEIAGPIRAFNRMVSRLSELLADLEGEVARRGQAVTQAQRLTGRLSWQATHDALTGLINRYEFEAALRQAVAEAPASGEAGRRGIVAYLDLDQFKLVNDTCGHVAGDELLRQVTLLLADRLGSRGTLARLGGDEFGLLLHPCTVEEARAIADELREAVACFRFAWSNRLFTIGVSIGLAEITGDASEDAERLMSAADTACYLAKDHGRNRVQLSRRGDPAVQDRNAEMQWISEINRALEHGRLRLYVQDIVAPDHDPAAGDRPRHFELLLRMLDDEDGLLAPGAFLVAAERYNLAPTIDRWVIRHACRWLAATVRERDALYAINLSGRSLTDDGFLEFVLDQLDAHAIRPENICFEITETAAISNLAVARHFMETLRQRGCRFSLDDFGSGLSSFGYLKDLPVEFLKIDGSFVRGIHRDPVHYAIVRSMNDVGHAMGMITIAEFVENRDILDCLRDIGVDLLQGHEYSRPRPLGAVAPALVTATALSPRP